VCGGEPCVVVRREDGPRQIPPQARTSFDILAGHLQCGVAGGHRIRCRNRRGIRLSVRGRLRLHRLLGPATGGRPLQLRPDLLLQLVVQPRPVLATASLHAFQLPAGHVRYAGATRRHESSSPAKPSGWSELRSRSGPPSPASVTESCSSAKSGSSASSSSALVPAGVPMGCSGSRSSRSLPVTPPSVISPPGTLSYRLPALSYRLPALSSRLPAPCRLASRQLPCRHAT